MWIIKRTFIALVATVLISVNSALDTSDKNNVSSGIMQILPKDAMTHQNKARAQAKAQNQLENEEKDLKTDATVTHTEPAPEFYRGVSADRTYDRFGAGADYQKGSWMSLDKESLYKNPYIANAYNKLANGGGTSTPSVSSLVSPNSSYRDRYGKVDLTNLLYP